MLQPKGVNLDKVFTVSGVKEVSGYTYVLLIDFAGLSVIKRINSDESEIKYHCIDDGETIDEFWVDPERHNNHGLGYTWISVC